MTLDDELTSAGSVVQAACGYVAQHLVHVAEVARLEKTIIDDYRKYLNVTTSMAQSTLNLCRRLDSTCVRSDEYPSEDAKQTIQGLIMGVLESITATYFVMNVVEQLMLLPDEHDSRMRIQQDETSDRGRCSFCGKHCKEGEFVAGPTVNICASCTRFACAVLGIALHERPGDIEKAPG